MSSSNGTREVEESRKMMIGGLFGRRTEVDRSRAGTDRAGLPIRGVIGPSEVKRADC